MVADLLISRAIVSNRVDGVKVNSDGVIAVPTDNSVYFARPVGHGSEQFDSSDSNTFFRVSEDVFIKDLPSVFSEVYSNREEQFLWQIHNVDVKPHAIEWSDNFLGQTRGCLLALLTSRSEVYILDYHRSNGINKWSLICHCTNLLAENSGVDLANPAVDETTLQSISAHCISWSPSIWQNGKKVCFLALGMHTGEIRLFRACGSVIELAGFYPSSFRAVTGLRWTAQVEEGPQSTQTASKSSDTASFRAWIVFGTDCHALQAVCCATDSAADSSAADLQFGPQFQLLGPDSRPISAITTATATLAGQKTEFIAATRPGVLYVWALPLSAAPYEPQLLATVSLDSRDYVSSLRVDALQLSDSGTIDIFCVYVADSPVTLRLHVPTGAVKAVKSTVAAKLEAKLRKWKRAVGGAAGVAQQSVPVVKVKGFDLTGAAPLNFGIVLYQILPTVGLLHMQPGEMQHRLSFVSLYERKWGSAGQETSVGSEEITGAVKAALRGLRTPCVHVNCLFLWIWQGLIEREAQSEVRSCVESEMKAVAQLEYRIKEAEAEAEAEEGEGLAETLQRLFVRDNRVWARRLALLFLWHAGQLSAAELRTEDEAEVRWLARVVTSHPAVASTGNSADSMSELDRFVLQTYRQLLATAKNPSEPLQVPEFPPVTLSAGSAVVQTFSFPRGSAVQLETVESDSGHVWARCSVTLLPLLGPDELVCEGCGKSVVEAKLFDQPAGPVVNILLEELEACCLYCGGRFVLYESV